jgi:hypothetical protein
MRDATVIVIFLIPSPALFYLSIRIELAAPRIDPSLPGIEVHYLDRY